MRKNITLLLAVLWFLDSILWSILSVIGHSFFKLLIAAATLALGCLYSHVFYTLEKES